VRDTSIVSLLLVLLICNFVPARENTENLADFYGFDEIEIIKIDWGIKDLHTADFNLDGRNDIVVANNRKAKIELLLQKDELGIEEGPMTVDPEDVDVNTITAESRFEKTSIDISQKIYNLVCGDLNTDGLMDIAYYGEPKALYVLIQKIDTTVSTKNLTLQWKNVRKIKIADGSTSHGTLACGDINNDNRDDLVLVCTDGIYVILQNPDGTLAEAVKYSTTSNTINLRIADLDGDQINDLVMQTTDVDKPIHVRFGLSTGQLGPQEQFAMDKPYVFETFDIDEKPGDEILSIDARSGRLFCSVIETDADPDGNWPIVYYPLAMGQTGSKRCMAVADIDGDGLDDITVSDPEAAELIFYQQQREHGLSEPVRFPALSDMDAVVAEDIDGDNAEELCVLSVKEKILGISDYADERITFPKPLNVVDEPIGMALADIDNDGTIDCVYISRAADESRSLRVIYDLRFTIENGKESTNEKTRFNQIPPTDPNTLIEANLSTDPNVLDTQNDQTEETVKHTDLKLEKMTANPSGIKVIDVDQDGLKDLLIFVQYESPMLIRQVEKYKFEVLDSPGSQASLIKDATMRSTSVADVDGKPGGEILIAQGNFARSLVFKDGKSWNIIDQYNAKSKENSISAVALFELENIGSAIVLLDAQKGQLQILKAGEDKTYRFAKQIDIGKWSITDNMKMLTAEVTGDSAKSIVLFDGSKFALITIPTESKKSRTLATKFSYETRIKDGIYGKLAVGDINLDDRADIIMLDYKKNHIEILTLDNEYKPVSAFAWKVFEEKSFAESKRTKTNVEPREMKVADVTGDGKQDLVTIIHDRIIIYPQD